jgi:predicted TIM-barrel fold metal-dependent hydrolase
MADVWADTALASTREIRAYIDTYGADKLLFGSDFPFGDPLTELNKVLDLDYGDEVKGAVVRGNLERLLAGNRTGLAEIGLRSEGVD